MFYFKSCKTSCNAGSVLNIMQNLVTGMSCNFNFGFACMKILEVDICCKFTGYNSYIFLILRSKYIYFDINLKNIYEMKPMNTLTEFDI